MPIAPGTVKEWSDLLVGIASLGVLEGCLSGQDPNHAIDNDALNGRIREAIALILSDVEAETAEIPVPPVLATGATPEFRSRRRPEEPPKAA